MFCILDVMHWKVSCFHNLIVHMYDGIKAILLYSKKLVTFLILKFKGKKQKNMGFFYMVKNILICQGKKENTKTKQCALAVLARGPNFKVFMNRGQNKLFQRPQMAPWLHFRHPWFRISIPTEIPTQWNKMFLTFWRVVHWDQDL